MDEARRSRMLKMMKLLPTELVDIIRSYLPPETTLWLERASYTQHHHLVWGMVPDHLKDAYIRDIIRSDHAFVFGHVIRERIGEWSKRRKYKYNGATYCDYLHFVYAFASNCGAISCVSLIKSIAGETLGTNWHKRDGVKYTKNQWTA